MFLKRVLICSGLLVMTSMLCGFTMGGFATPDTVVSDPQTSRLYVSNINGSPQVSDGNGFISLLDPNGKPIDMHFIRSGRSGVHLDAPKGMALSGNHLYVADLAQVHRFDKTTGHLKGTIDLGLLGATNLCGLALSPEGHLFVSDPNSNTIYKIDTVHQDQVSVFVKDKALKQPTALIYDTTYKRLLVGSWDRGGLVFVDGKGQVFSLLQKQFNRVKGMHFDRHGHLIFSDLAKGKIYRLRSYETLEVVRENLVTPANFGLDQNLRRMVIPSFRGNIVFSAPLPD